MLENKTKAKLAAGTPWADVVRTYSEGPAKDDAGDLGWFGRGMMVKPFEDAAFVECAFQEEAAAIAAVSRSAWPDRSIHRSRGSTRRTSSRTRRAERTSRPASASAPPSTKPARNASMPSIAHRPDARPPVPPAAAVGGAGVDRL